MIPRPSGFRWGYGQPVRKRRRPGSSEWQGKVVGFYATPITAEGYAVLSEREPGAVQIYPASALESLETLVLKGSDGTDASNIVLPDGPVNPTGRVTYEPLT